MTLQVHRVLSRNVSEARQIETHRFGQVIRILELLETVTTLVVRHARVPIGAIDRQVVVTRHETSVSTVYR